LILPGSPFLSATFFKIIFCWFSFGILHDFRAKLTSVRWAHRNQNSIGVVSGSWSFRLASHQSSSIISSDTDGHFPFSPIPSARHIELLRYQNLAYGGFFLRQRWSCIGGWGVKEWSKSIMAPRIFFSRVEIFCSIVTVMLSMVTAAKIRRIGPPSGTYFNKLISSDNLMKWAIFLQ
jgi:hypothetical protein